MSDERYLRWLSRYFFAPGYEPEDLLQEARIAAWLAPDCPRLAARRRLIELVRREVERRPQFAELQEAEDRVDVVELVTVRESLRRILRAVDDLTPLERRALVHVVNERPYRHLKQIDNAAMRARRKLRAAA